jgi:DNA-binding CsgD family transcriptional regulator
MEIDERIAKKIPDALFELFKKDSDLEFRNAIAAVLAGLVRTDRLEVKVKTGFTNFPESPYRCVVRIEGFRRQGLFIELERFGDEGSAFKEGERVALRFAAELVSDELKRRKRKSVSGEKLSSREIEIVELVRIGLSNREIGIQLGISEKTVKRHLYNIFNKTGVNSRLNLVLFLKGRETDG